MSGVLAQRAEQTVRARALLRESISLTKSRDQYDLLLALEELASIAGARGEVLRAVRLWGAAAVTRETARLPRPAFARPNYVRAVAAAQTTLTEVAWQAAWRAGWALSLEQAVADALDDDQ